MGKTPKTYEATDGEVYTITMCDPVTGRRLLLRLYDLMQGQSPTPVSIQNIMSGGGGSDSSFVDKADKLIEDILKLVMFKGKVLNNETFAACFSGKYDIMLELLLETCEYNGFFALIGGPILSLLNQMLATPMTLKKNGLSSVSSTRSRKSPASKK